MGLQHSLQRLAEIANTGGGRISRIVGENVEHHPADNLLTAGKSRPAIGLIGRGYPELRGQVPGIDLGSSEIAPS